MFNKPSISDYYRAVLKEFEKTIMKSDSKFIIKTETSDIVSQLLNSEHPLLPIEIDSEKKESITHRKEMRTVPSSRRDFPGDGDLDFEYEIIDITVPIISNRTIRQITDLSISTFSMSWSTRDFNITPNSISLSLDIKGYGFKHEDEKIVNEVAQLKKRINDWISWVNGDIEKETQILKTNLTNFVNERKNKLSSDVNRISGLSEKLGISIDQQ